MKRVLIVLFILLVSLSFIGAAQVGQPKVLYAYGKIGAGTLAFTTNQIQTSSTTIDLKNNADVQPSGDGVLIGTWNLDGTNQAAEADYKVTYSYGPLSDGSSDIDFELIALGEDDGSDVVKATNGTSLFTANAGNVAIVQEIAVRLTAAGVTAVASAPATDDYSSIITLTLETQ